MSRVETGESLGDRARTLLTAVLEYAPFPGSDELLRQVPHVQVRSGPITMLDLEVGSGATLAALPDGPAPVVAHVRDSGGAETGELLIWVTAGNLSALEYAWTTDAPPQSLPLVNQIHVVRR